MFVSKTEFCFNLDEAYFFLMNFSFHLEFFFRSPRSSSITTKILVNGWISIHTSWQTQVIEIKWIGYGGNILLILLVTCNSLYFSVIQALSGFLINLVIWEVTVNWISLLLSSSLWIGYPVSPYLIRPFPEIKSRPLNEDQTFFNGQIASARAEVEDSIGRMKV